MSVHDLTLTLALLFYTGGWLAYLHSKKKRADLYTDMAQLISDGEVDREDLRRSKDHREVQRMLERRDEDDDALEEARKDGEPTELFDE